MAWTAYKTWSAVMLTFAELNTYIRDNGNILKTSINDSGRLKTPAGGLLTIATGVITPTTNYHTLETESGAATDTLSEITPGSNVVSGHLLKLRVANAARAITIEHNAGGAANPILCPGGRDLILDSQYQTIEFTLGAGGNWTVSDLFRRPYQNIGGFCQPTAGGTKYVALNGSEAETNEASVRIPISFPGFIRNLELVLDLAPGAGYTYALTLRSDGVSKSVACSVADTAKEDSDTNEYEFAAGEDLCWLVTLSGSAANCRGHWQAEIEPL
jgi:hypothetical protein